ncbi:hypothetical protein ACOSQ3_012090 [Xanthoceras sorbifolium]
MEEGNAGPNPRRKDFIFSSLPPQADSLYLPPIDSRPLPHSQKSTWLLIDCCIHSPRIVLYLANVDRSSAVSGASPAPSTGSPRAPTAK